MFDSTFFKSNRTTLFKTAQVDCIAVTAAGLLQKSADTSFTFKQDTNFWYLTGCNEPDFILVITAAKHMLICPKREAHRDMWEGRINLQHLLQITGVDEVLDYANGMALLKSLITNKKVGVIVPPKAFLGAYGMYTNPARQLLYTKIKRSKPNKVIDIRTMLARQRSIKSLQEISCIQKAIDITHDSLNAVMQLKDYENEKDIEHALTYEFAKRGAGGHAYHPIIAADINATTIHYVANNDSLKNRQLLLFDVGAEYSGYAADISRVYALQKPSQRQQDVFECVLQVQQNLVRSVKPGMTLQDLEEIAVELLADASHKLGLSDKIRNYYPHAVSHHLGLDVHDAADYTQPLAAGMVITIEPGLYIPDESIGVRIEDDVLITDKGAINLSQKVPHDLLYYR